MLTNQIIELVHLSDKPLIDIFKDAEALWTAGITDDEAIYVALKEYYLDGRRKEESK